MNRQNNIELTVGRKSCITLSTTVGGGSVELTTPSKAVVALNAPGTNLIPYSIFYSGEIYAGETD